MATPDPTTPTFPAADLDRRFYAFLLDRLIAWVLFALAAWIAWAAWFRHGSVLPGVLLVVMTVLVVSLAFAAVLGVLGTSPGKALAGLRVVHHGTGTPIGLVPALIRTLVLGAATIPTFGLGLATLAQTAVSDPTRQRRGWHDRITDGIVVDVRPAPAPEADVEAEPRHIVNLTAMRLVPATAAEPLPETSRPAPRRTPAPPAAPPPAAPPPTAVVPAVPAGPPPPVRQSVQPTAVRPSGEGGGGSHRRVATWRISFDTGESYVVEGLGLVGRRPEPRPGEPVRHLVALPSQDMSLSKTHAQFQVAPDGVLVVMDRGSTNGSTLVRGGVPRRLPAGRPATLVEGDEVRLGDRTMKVFREA